jgi:SAM-dependent methyltransferase
MPSPVSSTWYENFFTELPNTFWRRAVPPEATEADVAFVERHLGLEPGSRVLDAPCGSGRHCLALASRGHRVTGVDISAEAISYARRSAASAGPAIEFIEAEMRTVPNDGRFDAAIYMGNSFGYLDPAGTRQFLGALAEAVRPGGRIVIDFAATAESVLPSFSGEPRTMKTGDITVTATNKYDVPRSRLISTYRFEQGARGLTSTALHQVYTCAQIQGLLGEAGFEVIALFADPDDTPFTLGAGRMLLTATR